MSKYYTNLAANGTTVIQPGAGFLHTITINTIGASANTCTVYDNTAASGTTIATINTTIAGAPTRTYDVEFKTGLTVVLAAGTAADITVTWTKPMSGILQTLQSIYDDVRYRTGTGTTSTDTSVVSDATLLRVANKYFSRMVGGILR